MKRIIALALSVFISFSLFNLPVLAASSTQPVVCTDATVKDYITQKAIDAFPEHTAKILGEHLSADNFSQQTTRSAPQIIICETRAISEDEYVNYTEYDNGLVVTSLMAHAGQNRYYVSDLGSYTCYKLNAWMTVSGSSDVLMIYGVQFYIYDTGNSTLLDYGYIETSQTTAKSAARGLTRNSGTSSAPAYVCYTATFDIEISTDGESIITLYNGTLQISGSASGPTVSGY